MQSPGNRDRRPRRDFRGSRPQRPWGGPPVDYRALVELIAKAVASDPDTVEVEAQDRGRGALAIRVKLAEADTGKLIGKGGRNIEALRTLIRIASTREHRRIFLDLA